MLGPAAALLLTTAVVSAPPSATVRLDEVVTAAWARDSLTAEGLTDDATFLRRVWLDLAGRVPPLDKARAFLDDRSPDRRVRLVDELLAGGEFSDHWGRTWAERLTARRPIRQEKYDGRVLHEYLRDALSANRSYRDVVREMLTGTGASDASGPANFLLRYEAKPTDLAGAVGKQFLGVTLQCAQCHDHPFAKWKQDDFWGVAAFFARVRLFESNDDEGGMYLTALLEAKRGELMRPEPNAKPDEEGKIPKKAVMPRLPGGAPVKAGPRRQALAEWITADANPYFARHAVNQVWTQLLGRGLVSSMDTDADAPSLGRQVLDLLTRDFTANGYNVKRLVRSIVLSRPYQLQAGGDSDREAGHRKLQQLARFPTRQLTADQLYRSIAQATGQGAEMPPAEGAEPENPESDPAVETFGERTLTVQRSLALLNSEHLHAAVVAGVEKVVAANGDKVGAKHIEWLFLATLSRRPTAAETTAMLKLARTGKDNAGLQDVLWVLLNSAEFNTNH